MTRQEAIKRLRDEEERLINRWSNCIEPEERASLLAQITHKRREIEILETMFCDPEVKS